MALYFGDPTQAKNRLNSATTPKQVIDYLCIPRKKVGSNESILCPDPNHNDKNYGSCIISRSGQVCRCYVCNKNFSPLQLLESYGGYNFYDAMCILADITGLEGEFESKNAPKEKKKPKEIRKLTNEEKNLLRIAIHSNIKLVKNASFKKEDAGLYTRQEDGMFVYYDTAPNPWVELARDDPEALNYMIKMRCISRIEDLYKVYLDLLHNEETKETNTLTLYMKEYKKSKGEILRLLMSGITELQKIACNN